jgi:hypothetical protein
MRYTEFVGSSFKRARVLYYVDYFVKVLINKDRIDVRNVKFLKTFQRTSIQNLPCLAI